MPQITPWSGVQRQWGRVDDCSSHPPMPAAVDIALFFSERRALLPIKVQKVRNSPNERVGAQMLGRKKNERCPTTPLLKCIYSHWTPFGASACLLKRPPSPSMPWSSPSTQPHSGGSWLCEALHCDSGAYFLPSPANSLTRHLIINWFTPWLYILTYKQTQILLGIHKVEIKNKCICGYK